MPNLAQAREFLDHSRLPAVHVIQFVEITIDQLRQWQSRNMVSVEPRAKTGAGRKLYYSVLDVLELRLAKLISSIGLPTNLAAALSREFRLRAVQLVAEEEDQVGLIAVFTPANADYGYKMINLAAGDTIYSGGICTILEIDRVIVETLAEMSNEFFDQDDEAWDLVRLPLNRFPATLTSLTTQ